MLLSDYEWQAVSLSLKVSLVAVSCSLPVGILAAWVLARCRFVGKSLLDSVIHLPLVLPPVVIGYLLLIIMGRKGVVGGWLYNWFGFSFSFSWHGAALASAVVAFPLMVRAIRLALEAVDTRLELAARTLGAGRWRVFFTITLPLTLPGIIVGTVLAFARSLGEFGATITFVSNIPGETRTIPNAMYTLIETPGAEMQAARLCIIAIVLSLVSLLLSEWLTRWSRKRLGDNAATGFYSATGRPDAQRRHPASRQRDYRGVWGIRRREDFADQRHRGPDPAG
ncbi:Molybdenum transport system permease protein ModB [Dickeya solani]|nr:Molybdenum transport system permease protein ModB [Dickeya solani]